jgi:hypothetical protein
MKSKFPDIIEQQLLVLNVEDWIIACSINMETAVLDAFPSKVMFLKG